LGVFTHLLSTLPIPAYSAIGIRFARSPSSSKLLKDRQPIHPVAPLTLGTNEAHGDVRFILPTVCFFDLSPTFGS
jgi:hypothetical protein